MTSAPSPKPQPTTAKRRPARFLGAGRWIPALLAANALLAAANWYQAERCWLNPLYCFEEPGSVWGLAATPGEATPECPTSHTYRQEVRAGEGRVEQFRLPGWEPKALLETFLDAGYIQQTDDFSADNYSAFLMRGTERLQYSAVRQGGTTLITVSGPGSL